MREWSQTGAKDDLEFVGIGRNRNVSAHLFRVSNDTDAVEASHRISRPTGGTARLDIHWWGVSA